jgi:hypothetical protein
MENKEALHEPKNRTANFSDCGGVIDDDASPVRAGRAPINQRFEADRHPDFVGRLSPLLSGKVSCANFEHTC